MTAERLPVPKGGRLGVRIAAGIGSIAAAACVAGSSAWKVDRAEQYYAKGRLESALRLTAREIVDSNRTASQRLIALHASILRDLGRRAEADAFVAFAQRYAAGENTVRLDSDLSDRDCSDRQPGYELIRSWGTPDPGPWESGTVVATFEIDGEGKIGTIDVLSAMDPAAAWLGIDTIGTARISKLRLDARQLEAPESFPISLCNWRNFDPLEIPIPADGRIRGRR